MVLRSLALYLKKNISNIYKMTTNELVKLEKALEKAKQNMELAKEQLIIAKENLKNYKTSIKNANKTEVAVAKGNETKCFNTDIRNLELMSGCVTYGKDEAKTLFLANKVQPSYLKNMYLNATDKLQSKIDKVVEKSGAEPGDILFIGSVSTTIGGNSAVLRRLQAYGLVIKTDSGYINIGKEFYNSITEGIQKAKEMYPKLNYGVAKQTLLEFEKKYLYI